MASGMTAYDDLLRLIKEYQQTTINTPIVVAKQRNTPNANGRVYRFTEDMLDENTFDRTRRLGEPHNPERMWAVLESKTVFPITRSYIANRYTVLEPRLSKGLWYFRENKAMLLPMNVWEQAVFNITNPIASPVFVKFDDEVGEEHILGFIVRGESVVCTDSLHVPNLIFK